MLTLLVGFLLWCVYLFIGGYVEEVLRPGGKCSSLDIALWPALLFGEWGNKLRRRIKKR